MDIYIVVVHPYIKYTRAFTTETKAAAYCEKLKRDGHDADVLQTRLNKESRYEPQN